MARTKRTSSVTSTARRRVIAANEVPPEANSPTPRAIAFAVATAFLPWYLPQTAYGQTIAPNTLPTNGQVTAGSGKIYDPQGSNLQIDQYSSRAVFQFGSFSIGSAAHVNVTQPGVSSVGLIRDVGGSASQIFGGLTANGQLFISNQNGVLFGAGARVDVGALFATSLSIQDHDFMAGRYLFSNSGNAGKVINEGTIITANGYTALVGPQVRNDGIIIARQGTVVLAAADRVSLDLIGDGLISLNVDQAALNASVVNTGRIEADGGFVLLTARSANALLDTVINTTGVIRANSLIERNGEIVLDGGSTGVVAVRGTLEAAGVDGGTTGGTIKVLGDKVGLFGTATLNASGDAGGGTVLVGGNFQGKGPERNSTVTYVGPDAAIDVSAVTTGNGGKAIVWSDGTTKFVGSVAARGGAQGGDGGFIEISGKEKLIFNPRSVDASAPKGRSGSLLLDPSDLTITDAADGTGTLDDELTPNSDGQILAAVPDDGANTVSRGQLEAFAGTVDITLEATGLITVNNMAGNLINLQTDSNHAFTLRSTSGGNINFQDANDEIRTQGGSITLVALGGGDLSNIGKLTSNGGAIILSSASGLITANGAISAGNGTVGLFTGTGAGSQAITLGTNASISGSTVTLESGDNGITQGTAGITATNLRVSSADAVNLSSTANNVTNLAASVTAAGQAFTFVNGNSLTVANVTSINISGNSTTTSGVTTNSGALSITANGTLTTSQAVNSQGDVITLATQGSGSISLGADVTATGQTVTLNSAGGVNQTAGAITGTSLRVLSANAVNLTSSTNDVTSLAANVSGSGQGFSYTDATALTVTTVTTVGVTTTNGAISLTTQNGTLTLTQQVNAGTGNVTLTAQGTGSDITGAGNITGSAVALTATDQIIHTGTLVATDLGIHAAAVTNLTVPTNLGTLAVNITGGGGFSHTDTDSLTIGTVGPISGLTTSNGAISITTSNGSLNVSQAVNSNGNTVNLTTQGTGADLALGANVSGSIVTLNSAAGVNQTAGGISATSLRVLSVNAVALTSTTNNVTNLAANVTGSGQSFSYTDADLLTVNTVTTTGVSTNNGDIALTTTNGTLTLSQPVNAGTGNVTLNAQGSGSDIAGGGNISGTSVVLIAADAINYSGTLTATNLAIQAASASLTAPNVDVIAANITGAGNNFSYTDADSVTIGTVGNISGITTANGAISVQTSNGALNVNQAVNAGTSTVGLTAAGGNLTINANVSGSGVNLTASADNIVLAGNVNATGTLGLFTGGIVDQTSGTLTAGTLTGNVTGVANLSSTNAITNLGAFDGSGGFTLVDAGGLTVTGAVSNGGAVSLTTDAGTLAVTTGSVSGTSVNLTTTTSGNISLGGNVSAPAGTVTLTSAGGVSQSAGGITATNLQVDALNAVNLSSATNNVSSLAGTVSGAGQSFSYTEGGAVDVTTVSSTGVTTNNGAISLTTTNGTLILSEQVNAGTGNVTLTAQGAGSDIIGSGNITGTSVVLSAADTINYTGTLTATSLAIQAAAASLTFPNVDVIAANITGSGNNFTYTDADSVTIGTVGNISGITTNNGNISVTTNAGALTVNQAVNAGTSTASLTAVGGNLAVNAGVSGSGGINLTTTTSGDIALGANLSAGAGTVTLSSAGGVSQSAGGITAAGLQVDAANAVNLTSATNNVTSLAGSVSGSGQSFSYTDADALDVTTVGSAGVTTNNGNITLATTNGSLTLTEQVNAGTTNTTVILSAQGTGSDISGAGNVTGTSVAFIAADSINYTGSLIATNLAIQATTANFTFPNVDVIAANITGAGNPFSYTDVDSVTVGTVGNISGVTTNNGAIDITTNAGALTIAQPVSAGTSTVTLTATSGNLTINAGVAGTGGINLATNTSGDIALGANVSAGAGTVSLSSAGDIDQTTGGITAATLNVSGGNVNLASANNAITTLDAFSGTGNFTLVDGSGGLTLNGQVSSTLGAISITTAGGALTLGGNNVSGVGVTLQGAGVTQSAGSAISGLSGDVTINGGGAAINMSGSVAGANVTVQNATAVALPGINAGSGTTVLGVGGDITGAVTQTSGTNITSATLSGNTTSSVTLTEPGNQIGNLGPFATNGNFTLIDSGLGLNVTGAVNAGTGTASITTSGGDLFVTTGSVTGNGVTLNTTANIFLSGTVDAGAGTASLTAGSGEISGAGTVVAGNLTLSAQTGISLANTQAANLQATNTVSGDIQITNSNTALAVVGSGISNPNGALILNNDATVTVNSPITVGAFTVISASGATSDIAVNANVTGNTLGGWTTNFFAGRNLTQAASTTIDAGDWQLLLSAGTSGTGSITMNGAVSVNPLPFGGGLTAQAPGAIQLPSGSAGATLSVNSDIGGAGGNVTQAAGGLTVTGATNITAGTGSITLSDPLNDFGGTVTASGANIALTDANSIQLGTVTANGNLTVVALAGDITQDGSGPTTVTGTSNFTASGNVSFNGFFPPGNDFNVVDGSAGGDLILIDANDITLNNLSAGGEVGVGARNITLTGNVTGNDVTLIANFIGFFFPPGDTTAFINQTSGIVTAVNLDVRAPTTINLPQANAITNLVQGSSAGGFTLVNVGALNVTGPVTDSGGTVSLTTSNGTLSITTGSVTGGNVSLTTVTSGDISLAGSVSAGAGSVVLDSAGAITQSAGTITAGSLGLRAVSAPNITTSDVGVLAANITGAGNNFSYTDANSLTIGTVGPISGVTTNNGAISLTTNEGSLTVNQPVNANGNTVSLRTQETVELTVATLAIAANVTGTNVTLTSADNINQTAGTITATNLGIQAEAVTALTTPNVNVLAANITGLGNGFSYSDADSVTIGTVGPIVGVTTNNGPISLTTNNGPLTVSNAVNANGNTVTLSSQGAGASLGLGANVNGSTVTLNSANDINQTAGVLTTGTLTGSAGTTATLNASNAITNLGAFTSSGGFTLNDLGGLAVTGAVIDATGAVSIRTSTGTLAVTTGNVTGNNVTLQNTAGIISINNRVDAGAGTATLTAGTSIRDAGTGLIIGNTAVLTAGSFIGACNAACVPPLGPLHTQVANLQATVTGGGGGIEIVNTGNVTLNGVTHAGFGGFVFDNTGSVTIAAPINVTRRIGITATTDIAVNANLTAASNDLGGGGNNPEGFGILLTAGGNITQSAPTVMTAASFSTIYPIGLFAGGSISLGNAANDFASPVSASGANITLADANSITLGTFSPTTFNPLPVTATGNLSVTANGAITDGAPISVQGTSTFAPGAGNSVTLVNAGNDFVGAVSVTNGLNATIVDASALQLGSVNITGALSATATTGDITSSGPLLVAGNSTFTANGAGASITVNNTTNNFGGAVSFTGAGGLANVSVFDTTPLDLGGSTLSGNLTATASDITQSGLLTVGGTTNVTATAGNVSLDTFFNDLRGPVNASGNNVLLRVFNTFSNTLELGTVTAANNLDVNSTGDILLNGNVNASSTATFAAGFFFGNGNVTQSSGTLTAGTLTGSTGSVSGSVNLPNASNAITNLGSFTSAGSFTLVDGSGGLTLLAPVSAPGAVSITTAGGPLALGGNSVSGQGVTLSGQGVTSLGGSTVNGGSLDILIDGNDGAINLAGALTTTSNSATAVQIIDATSAALGNITTGASGTVTLGGAGVDNLSGAVTQTGVINTRTLTGNTGSTVALGNSNTLVNLGAFTSSGGFTLNDATGGLTVAGAVSDAAGPVSITTTGGVLSVSTGTVTGNNVTLAATSSSIFLSNNVDAGTGTATLTAAGGIFRFPTPTGTIFANNLVLTAGGGIGAGNNTLNTQVSTLQASAGGGGIEINNTGNLAITGSGISNGGGGLILGNTGSVTIAAPINVTTRIAINASTDIATNANLTAGSGGVPEGNNNPFAIGIALTAGGNITQAAPTIMNSNGSPIQLIATGGSISLGNPANDFTGPVSASGANITLADANSITLGTITPTFTTGFLPVTATGNLSVTANGAITDGYTVTAQGASTFTPGAGNSVTLDSPGNDFVGAVSVPNGLNATVVDANALNLGPINITGNLSATATTGGITNTGGALTIGGSSTFTAPGASILVNNAGNNFNGPVSFGGAGLVNVTVVDTTALDLGTTTMTGNLSVTANGAITDSGTLTVGGTSTFTPGAANSVTLDTASNNFTGAVSVTNGTNATVVDANALNLGPITITGNLAATATAGDITNTGGALTIGGNSNFIANGAGANISVNNAGNNFNGAVSFSGAGGLANVTVVDTTALDLGASNISGNLSATATSLTQSGALVVGGTTTATATAGNVTLSNAGNNFGTVAGGGTNFTVVDANTLNLGPITTIGTLAATATTGGITNTGGALLIGGNSTFTAPGASISVNNAGNNFTGSVSFGGAGLVNVNVLDTTALDLGASTLTNLTAQATSLTQSGPLLISGTTSATATAGGITFNTAANDFGGPVTLSSTGAALISDINALTLANVTTGNLTATSAGVLNLGQGTVNGNLVANSGGNAMIQSGALTVTGTTNLTAGVGTITLGSGNDFVGTVTVASGGTSVFQDTNTITFASPMTLTGSLTVTAPSIAVGNVTTAGFQQYNGNVTMSSTYLTNNNTFNVTGTTLLNSSSTVNIGTSSATFGGAVNANTGSETLTIIGTGNTTLGGAVTVGSLTTSNGTTTISGGTVSTTGAQTYSGPVTLTTPTTLSSSGSGAINLAGAVTGGANSLAVNTGGTTTFGGAVTAGSVTTDPGGSTAINGGSVTTTGAQTYGDNVTLGGATTLSATTSTFNGNVVGGGNSLAITGGAVLGDAGADSVTGISNLSVSGGTAINANTVTTTGTQTYTGPATVANAPTLTGTNITFGNTLNGAAALTVNGSGTTTFTGAVGGGTPLTSLTTGGGGTTAINGGGVNAGTQTYNDAVTLGTNTVFNGSTAVFNGGLNGGGNNVAFTLSGVNTINGATMTGVNNLLVDGGGTTGLVGTITTAGSQTYIDPITPANNVSLISTGGGAITATNPANDFTGTLNLSGGNTQIVDANTLTLGNVSTSGLSVVSTGALDLGQGMVSGPLNATSNGGDITQTGSIVVTGATALNAGTGSIMLPVVTENVGVDLTGVVGILNDFQGPVTAVATGPTSVIQIADINTLTPAAINAGTGSVFLTAVALGSGGPITAGTASALSSDTNVSNLNLNMPDVPLNLYGLATQWGFISVPPTTNPPNPVGVLGSSVGVTYNFSASVLTVLQLQAQIAASTVSASVAAAILEETKKTFGTDSVAEDVEYGFAGEIGSTPPMDHRIDESGISLPRCVTESREGVPCRP